MHSLRKILLVLLIGLLLLSCQRSLDRRYQDRDFCFLLYDRVSRTFVMEQDRKYCQLRLPPCSTFKVPLAVVAFDTGLLDPDRRFRWNGEEGFLPEWNQDQDAASWMKHSVVWVSRILAQVLGDQRFREAIGRLSFGELDSEADFTSAWLISPASQEPGLRINGYEQVRFTDRLWSFDLPFQKEALRKTQEILVRQGSNGYTLSGKTGSGYYDDRREKRLGWYVGRLTGRGQDLIVVSRFSDREPSPHGTYGGIEARNMAQAILRERGLW